MASFPIPPSEFLGTHAAQVVAMAVETLKLYNEPRAAKVRGPGCLRCISTPITCVDGLL